jgi:integrase
MATIIKRGDGQWQVKIRRSGYPVQSKTFAIKGDAEAWARLVESEMDRGVYVSRVEAERQTFGDILKRYAKEVSPTKRGCAEEELRIQALLRRSVSQYSMATLSSQKIAEYRDQRLTEVSSSTVNRELNLIGHVIETARREWGVHLSENPVRLVRRPRTNPPRERRLLPDEEPKLFAGCTESRNEFLLPIVRLALETAMRQGEIVSLRWPHVNVKKRVAFLPETKNGESRGVPLSRAAVKVLKFLPRSEKDDSVFPGVTTEAVKRAFIRACERAKIENLHFHDLRHEATTRLFEKGLNPMQVAAITGHKTLQMLKRYTHLQAEDLAKMLDQGPRVRNTKKAVRGARAPRARRTPARHATSDKASQGEPAAGLAGEAVQGP